jgi:hypothetical protein
MTAVTKGARVMVFSGADGKALRVRIGTPRKRDEE